MKFRLSKAPGRVMNQSEHTSKPDESLGLGSELGQLNRWKKSGWSTRGISVAVGPVWVVAYFPELCVGIGKGSGE